MLGSLYKGERRNAILWGIADARPLDLSLPWRPTRGTRRVGTVTRRATLRRPVFTVARSIGDLTARRPPSADRKPISRHRLNGQNSKAASPVKRHAKLEVVPKHVPGAVVAVRKSLFSKEATATPVTSVSNYFKSLNRVEAAPPSLPPYVLPLFPIFTAR